MQKLLQIIKESFQHDEERDYTAMSVNRAIFLLSLPMVIEMSFEALFALVDAFYVARFVGVNGVATVGLTESVLTLIYSLAWGIAAASTAIIARRVGEKDRLGASKVVAQIINVSVLIGVLIASYGTLFPEQVLQLMGADKEVIAEGVEYTRIQFLSTPIILLLFTLGGALRGSGDASSAMKAVIIANVINIALDTLFIPILGLGVAGAAYATLIGRSVGVVYQFYVIFEDKREMKLNASYFIPVKEILIRIVKIASGSTGQFLIQSASWVFLVRILSIYGSEVIAGYTIAIRVIIFTILPSWGMANAAATLVGQNLGAGKPERSIQSAWRVTYINMIFLGIIGIFFFIFANEIVLFFDTTPVVVETAVNCLYVLAAGYVLFGAGMIITQAINGAGDTLPPTIINLICFWIIEIPLAYYLGEVILLKEMGVFYSIIIAETILAILAILYFRTNRWQKVAV